MQAISQIFILYLQLVVVLQRVLVFLSQLQLVLSQLHVAAQDFLDHLNGGYEPIVRRRVSMERRLSLLQCLAQAVRIYRLRLVK